MQPPLNSEELERLYPHLHPDERNEKDFPLSDLNIIFIQYSQAVPIH